MEDEDSPALIAGVDFRDQKNGTERVAKHVRPGRTRAPFLRYIRINLPLLTRFVLLLIAAINGAASAAVALSDHVPFPFADQVLLAVSGAAALFVMIGLLTSWRIWRWGGLIAVLSLLVYLGSLAGDPPYVWNGASIPLAAVWNVTLLSPLAYLILYWMMNYGIIVAAPDNQNFLD